MLRELAMVGFRHAPEVARQIIQEQVATSGTALPWGDRKAYTDLMLQRSIESYLEHTPAWEPTFSDRGIPDSLGYARLIGLVEEENLRTACREYRYALRVFLAPPWREIYETDSERKQDFAEAERTYSVVKDVYRECGYEIVELPRIDPVARAAWVVTQLQL
jgi:predicted ATPase